MYLRLGEWEVGAMSVEFALGLGVNMSEDWQVTMCLFVGWVG